MNTSEQINASKHILRTISLIVDISRPCGELGFPRERPIIVFHVMQQLKCQPMVPIR